MAELYAVRELSIQRQGVPVTQSGLASCNAAEGGSSTRTNASQR